ncbi:CHAP domain-containing protein [uncultured Piscinibacter sp.]|uniref:CHAP domain-containing protein n=1 Tax=uncultured Piscinibacter sp. TaxID=1131835 RepID=UPI002604BFF5|nr:CHAP domain-containing protein [uncultured Piscinibacter sp.]
MLADELIRRAREAMRTPTLYLLGGGGFYADEPGPHPHPGREARVADVLAALARKDAEKHARYLAEAQAAGIDLELLGPKHMPFCDCSGYACWALDMPRAPSASAQAGWVWTGSIYDEGRRPGGGPHFVRIDSDGARLACRPGAMLVFPAPSDRLPGHVGIVTETDDVGRPLKVLHCSSLNLLIAPAGGAERSAIAETDAEPFLEQLAAPQPTIAVWPRNVQE